MTRAKSRQGRWAGGRIVPQLLRAATRNRLGRDRDKAGWWPPARSRRSSCKSRLGRDYDFNTDHFKVGGQVVLQLLRVATRNSKGSPHCRWPGRAAALPSRDSQGIVATGCFLCRAAALPRVQARVQVVQPWGAMEAPTAPSPGSRSARVTRTPSPLHRQTRALCSRQAIGRAADEG